MVWGFSRSSPDHLVLGAAQNMAGIEGSRWPRWVAFCVIDFWPSGNAMPGSAVELITSALVGYWLVGSIGGAFFRWRRDVVRPQPIAVEFVSILCGVMT